MEYNVNPPAHCTHNGRETFFFEDRPPPAYKNLLSKLLPRLCKWQQVKMWSYMTWEPTDTIKPKLRGGCNENAYFWIWPMDYVSDSEISQ